jgi:hypothetical protein
LKEGVEFRLSLEPEFVRGSFGDATLRVNGREARVSRLGLLLLRRSELTLEDSPALEELISLLRRERVVSRDAAELRGVSDSSGRSTSAALARLLSDCDLADLNDFDSAVATPVDDLELTKLIELEVAVGSAQPLEALSKTASFRAGDWQRRALPVHASEADAVAGNVAHAEGDPAELS